MNLSANGKFIGSPEEAGTFALGVRVTDAAGAEQNVQLDMIVSSSIHFKGKLVADAGYGGTDRNSGADEIISFDRPSRNGYFLKFDLGHVSGDVDRAVLRLFPLRTTSSRESITLTVALTENANDVGRRDSSSSTSTEPDSPISPNNIPRFKKACLSQNTSAHSLSRVNISK